MIGCSNKTKICTISFMQLFSISLKGADLKTELKGMQDSFMYLCVCV